MGCALPINDMYGTEEQMYKEPDALYQASRLGTATGITKKAEDKDLATLFTYLDWTYTDLGARTVRIGLNEEQYESVELNPDLHAAQNIKGAYTESEGEDGKSVIVTSFSDSDTVAAALQGHRMDTGINLTGNSGEYVFDKGNTMVYETAMEQWTKYLNTGNVLDYTGLLNTEESERYGKINTAGIDYQAQNVPNVIKGTMSWEDYVKGLDNIDTDTAVEMLQKYVSVASTAKH